MRNRWDERHARRLTPREVLVYRSRLIGGDAGLGLFGGGNTSIKCVEPDPFGQPRDVLWVKGSGVDLAGCEPRHFTPLPLEVVRRLAVRRTMADADMMAFLERATLDPKAPRPSIETLLHAFIPEPSVDHTHADAILALANSRHGRALIRDVLGAQWLWIPYLQPGFQLSRRVFEAYRAHPAAPGAVLEKHGLITWGANSRASYARTIGAVTRAERFLTRERRRRRWSSARWMPLPAQTRATLLEHWLPSIRRTFSQRRRVCLAVTDTPDVLEFVNARRMPEVARLGPATPDHMLRTKRLPCILENGARGIETLTAAQVARQLQRYARAHQAYVRRHQRAISVPVDPTARVILIPRVGMITAGKDATDCAMVAALYRHAMAIMRDATLAGGYTSVSERQAFGVEYWPLELYKLSLAPPEAELARHVGLITGAAGGIGRAIARHMVARGASVVVTDLNAKVVEHLAEELNAQAGRRRALGLAMDVTSERSIARAFEQLLRTFGGLDFLVSNAGVAHVAAIDRLGLLDWERSVAVNATGHFLVARSTVRLLRAQGLGGTLVFIASKNVLAPGKEFGAYSAAKAAQAQLARVLAIENGEWGIRANVVNPDGVFEGSGLWETIRASRAKTYRIAPAALETYYQRRNLLQAKVLPEDVAEAVGFFVSPRSAKTTGCILTVDGGLREAFPR